MQSLLPILLAFYQIRLIAAGSYTWNINWVNRNPDYLHSRPVIAINSQWPPPTLYADVGEQITIQVNNQLGNESASVHFHGLFQNGTNEMDGPAGLTQCPIGPGESFTYVFQVTQPGTYWYHSHVKAQYPDGLRGPLIVRDKSNPYASQYKEELQLTMSDWYHNEMPNMIPGFLSVSQNPSGAEPVPDSCLLNDNLTTTFNFTAGETYMIRMINMAAFAAFYVTFDQHEMTIVEVDGVYTQPAKTNLVYLTAAQRMSVLVTAKSSTSQNYAFVGAMDPSMFDHVPNSLKPYLNATGYLVYDKTKPLPKSAPTLSAYAGAYDDYSLIPYDRMPLLGSVTKRLTFAVTSGNSQAIYGGQNRFAINNSTYIEPKVPTLYTVLSTGTNATNVKEYGKSSNPYIINSMDVVEVVVNNYDTGGHPIHMHGHNFQMVQRSGIGAGTYSGTPNNPPATPIRRDVIKVNQGGYLVYRFVADNPGVWAFHCHIDWHLIAGFFATIIEAPPQIQQKIKVPAAQYSICNSQGRPYQGNAVGNTQDPTSLADTNSTIPSIDQQSAVVSSS